MRKGPRFSRVVPILVLAGCSLYVVHLFWGTQPEDNAVHWAAVRSQAAREAAANAAKLLLGVKDDETPQNVSRTFISMQLPGLDSNPAATPSPYHVVPQPFSEDGYGRLLLLPLLPAATSPDSKAPQPVATPEISSREPSSEAGAPVISDGGKLAQASQKSEPLRFYVHKLSKQFDAEGLVKKHAKCVGFQWSNDLKLLRHVRDGKTTQDAASADFLLVPFLSKCWFNFEAKYRLDKMEQAFNAIVGELEETEAWRRWPEKHVFIFSSGVGPTLVPGWRKVRKGIFILAEGDRSAGFYASDRDIVIPGVGKATKGQVSDLDLHRPRSLLATFRGTLVRGHARDEVGKSVFCRSLLRQALLNLAKSRKDVAINDRRYTDDQGTLDKKSYKKELADSTFCIIPRGLTPWTSRLFDAIALDCIPVILSNAIVFPYERSIDYSQFTIKLPESWVGQLWSVLDSIPSQEIRALQIRVRKAAPLFLGKGPIDAVVAELAKLRSKTTAVAGGTKNSMNTFWAPGRGTFQLTGNEARQVGPSYSAGAQAHPASSQLWVPDDAFKNILGNLWHEENCVPCPKCKFGQWFLR